MEPRYFAGEAVFVNPRRPVRPDDFVVVQVLEGNEHDHELHCYVKQYKGQKNGDFLFWQFNPDQEVKFSKSQVSKIHKIIGTGEG
jgi:phage repressor protein C with HTH and peptisase S24 domain